MVDRAACSRQTRSSRRNSRSSLFMRQLSMYPGHAALSLLNEQ
jgi:hypothetical protein